MSRFILAIDQGTTSTRAIVLDAQAQAVAQAQEEFPQHFPASGWVEHEPDDLWDSTLSTARAALARAGLEARDIAGIGITNQRETTLVWDRASGEAVGRAIVWQDRRTAPACAQLRRDGYEALVTQRTGLIIDPYFSATKVAWILDNVPGARARAERGELAFGTVDGYLLWRLTGGAVHAVDATNASRTLLYDIHRGAWDRDLLALFRVPESLLPEVRDCAGAFGETLPEWFGAPIPIRGVAGDQQAAMVGQACFRPGMIKSTYGTGCFALVNTGTEAIASRNRLLTTIAYQLGGERTYALEGSIFVAGAVVQWLRDGLGLIEHAAETGPLAAEADPEQELYLVPAFVGLGAPHWNPDVRGALFGLTRNSGPAEFARGRAGERLLPDRGPAGGDARRLVRRGRHGAAGRWRHGSVRLDHAAPLRPPRRAGRPAADPGDDRARRRLSRRSLGRALPGARAVRRPLAPGAPLPRRHERADPGGEARRMAAGGEGTARERLNRPGSARTRERDDPSRHPEPGTNEKGGPTGPPSPGSEVSNDHSAAGGSSSIGWAPLSACFCCRMRPSRRRAIERMSATIEPVPAGMSEPTMTFSFRPSRVSTLPLTAASVRTRVVSWNEAAEMNDFVWSDALVMPSSTGTPTTGFLPSASSFSLMSVSSVRSI